MWSDYGAQMEPFPSRVTPPYQMLVWESIHQNGNACDYISEQVLADATFDGGWINYGTRKYHTLFLIEVKSISPQTAQKLYDFVKAGGRIFCIEAYPTQSLGWFNHQQKDAEVKEWIDKLKQFPERFILLSKPESNFKAWYQAIQAKYAITPYVKIANPNTFVTQVRYQTDNAEIFIFNNASAHLSIDLDATFLSKITANKQAWIWDAATGDKFKLDLKNGQFKIKLYPADSRIIVFNNEKDGQYWQPIPELTPKAKPLKLSWKVSFKHMDGTVKNAELTQLRDLKDIPAYTHFAGTVSYKANLELSNPAKVQYLDLGKVFGIAELMVNGQKIGTTWYGRNAFVLNNILKKGSNIIEIKVTTVMLNYMKSLTENATAQYWANNSKRKEQPLQSMGMVGPVNLF